MAATAPKAFLLLGILLAAFLLLSTHAIDASQEKETKGTATDADSEDNVVDNKQSGNCGSPNLRCCKWAREGINNRLRCIQYCPRAVEADPAQLHRSTSAEGTATDAASEDNVVDNKQSGNCGSPNLRCCRWARVGISNRLRCIQCCPRPVEADPAHVDGVMETQDPQN